LCPGFMNRLFPAWQVYARMRRIRYLTLELTLFLSIHVFSGD
jgi:hypothetical protein